jgi:hypothetical protein
VAGLPLDVDQPDQPAGRGVLDRGAQAVRLGAQLVEAPQHREPRVLDELVGARRQAEPLERPRAQPARVHVAADEHDRVPAAHRVELGDGRRARPGRPAVAVAEHRADVVRRQRRDVLGHQRGRRRGVGRPAQVEAGSPA